MKHLKLFENQSFNSIRNAIDIYKKFIIDIKPVVFEKYNELARMYEEDESLEYPEYGDRPLGEANDNYFYIDDIQCFDDKFEFCLNETDKHGNLEGSYYIILTDEEIEDGFIKIDANKYNV